MAHFAPGVYSLGDLSAAAFKLDVPGALNLKGGIGLSLLEIIFVFLLVDLFDNVGTLVAVTKRAGLIGCRRLDTEAEPHFVGGLAGHDGRRAGSGTSPVTSYIESAAGVAVGGRTGLTSVVVGILFLCTLFFAPLVQAIPTAATAPALILVGAHDDGRAGGDGLGRSAEAIPAFLTVIIIPLSYLDRQRPRIRHHQPRGPQAGARPSATRSDWLMYVLAALFVARFIYLA